MNGRLIVTRTNRVGQIVTRTKHVELNVKAPLHGTTRPSLCVVGSNYWQLLSHRAAGKVMTNAHWIRQFIRTHPEYRYQQALTMPASPKAHSYILVQV
jgi:hypothetical protein